MYVWDDVVVLAIAKERFRVNKLIHYLEYAKVHFLIGRIHWDLDEFNEAAKEVTKAKIILEALNLTETSLYAKTLYISANLHQQGVRVHCCCKRVWFVSHWAASCKMHGGVVQSTVA